MYYNLRPLYLEHKNREEFPSLSDDIISGSFPESFGFTVFFSSFLGTQVTIQGQ